MGYKVACVGATGNVGREMLNILDERSFPADEVVALASRRSVGTEVSYGDRTLKVKASSTTTSATSTLHDVGGGSVSTEWCQDGRRRGGDRQFSAWRYDADVPLIVRGERRRVTGFSKRNIIANPNCSTAQLVSREAAARGRDIKARRGVDHQSCRAPAGCDGEFSRNQGRHTTSSRQQNTKRIAFNVIPQIDVFMEDGYTKEEWKMVAETKKILDPKIALTATCVRVPVFIGHSEAVNIEFEKPITPDEAREILRKAPGLLVIDKHEPGGYATPYECAGEDATYISRIREDATVENGLAFWCVSTIAQRRRALCVQSRMPRSTASCCAEKKAA